ncbi:MAG: hypothetical protein LBF81_04325, partial [Prevotellaceae bacterium]|nr:hypothetical protein [Prevotellaceae bacterium]
YLPADWIVVHFGCQNVLGYKNIYGYEYAKSIGAKRAITSSDTRFIFLGAFFTFSKSKTVNELKNL